MAEARIVIGVSYIDLVDDLTDEIEDKIEDSSNFAGLTVYYHCPEGAAEDVLIGVGFSRRPTDTEVAEAKEKVELALLKLIGKLGHPQSKVEEWMVVED